MIFNFSKRTQKISNDKTTKSSFAKFLPYIFGFLLIVIVLTPVGFAFGQAKCADGTKPVIVPDTGERICDKVDANGKKTGTLVDGNNKPIPPGEEYTWVGNAALSILASISTFIMSAIGLVLYMSGSLLNYIIQSTVVDMATGIEGMTGIDVTWRVVRDVVNIFFIFILVFEGILIIISQSSIYKAKQIIIGVIITSVLMNFSVFFTKVIIDASNIATIGFYKSIYTAGQNQSGTINNNTDQVLNGGISGAFTNALKVSTIYNKDAVKNLGAEDSKKLIIIGIGGSILFLVLAFVFFAISAMFVIRYVAFLLLLMFSPLGFIGWGLPKLKSVQDQWWKALWSQVIFAPVYMFLTWVILTLISSDGFFKIKDGANFADLLTASNGTAVNNSIGLIINFVVIIGLAIFSLTKAREISNGGSTYIANATGKLTTFAGGAVMGGGAWAMRKSVGNIGRLTADNAKLQEAAATKTGFTGAGARLALYASKKAQSGSFDVRSATVPTNAIGDLIEGTAGRTKVGKFFGLNDVNIPSYAAGAALSGMAGTGTGGTKGVKEEREESQKRVRDREAAAASELRLAQNRRAVVVGSRATATPTEITAMEDALSKLSAKETETLVASNRELLKSLNFANKISVQQLDALNKSDQFSDTEKNDLKNARFSNINAAMTAGTTAAIGAIRNNIRDLSDSELEMIDPAYLGNEHFVSHLKSGQMETINKSGKFTTNQKTTLRNTRKIPLMAAIAAGNVVATGNILRGLGHKEVASLDMVTLLNPTMLQAYIPNMLQRMAPEMNPADIPILRNAILASVPPAQFVGWLTSPAGVAAFS